MEQSEKIEKPRWVELVESLPEAARQTVGNLCARVIQDLTVLGCISADLIDAVADAVLEPLDKSKDA